MPPPVHIGVVGTGSISVVRIPVYQDFPEVVRLAAVCDVNEDAARAFAQKFGDDVRVYTSLDEMLDSDIEAVDICTPHFLHSPQAIDAAKAGKHVLVEKPMACSVDESRDMVEAADAAGVTLMVAQYLRYLPTNRGVRKLIEDGNLGRLEWARADDFFPGLPRDGWVRDAQLAGGGVLHMGGTHHIDLFRYFFGDVGAVRARTWTDNPLLKNGSEDRAVATLEFENGVEAHLVASWGRPGPHLFQWVVSGDGGSVHSIYPDAPEGMRALYEHQAPAIVSSRDTDGFVPVEPVGEPTDGNDPWANEILHFAACIRDGREPVSSGRDNLETMKTLYACYESARTGGEVRPADM